VVKLIHSIAAQTNLLALNATIEARGPANPAAASRWSPPSESARQPDRQGTEEISAQLRRCSIDRRRGRGSAASPRPSPMSEITVNIPRDEQAGRCDARSRDIQSVAPARTRSRPYRRCHTAASATGTAASEVLRNARDSTTSRARCATPSTLPRKVRAA